MQGCLQGSQLEGLLPITSDVQAAYIWLEGTELLDFQGWHSISELRRVLSECITPSLGHNAEGCYGFDATTVLKMAQNIVQQVVGQLGSWTLALPAAQGMT